MVRVYKIISHRNVHLEIFNRPSYTSTIYISISIFFRSLTFKLPFKIYFTFLKGLILEGCRDNANGKIPDIKYIIDNRSIKLF